MDIAVDHPVGGFEASELFLISESGTEQTVKFGGIYRDDCDRRPAPLECTPRGAARWWPFDPPAIQPFDQSAPQHGRGSRRRGDTALKSTVSKIFLWKS